MSEKKYYAQFDGDEVDGKIYRLGEPLKDSVDAGTIAYLVGMGRIGSTPPAEANKDAGDLSLPDDSDPRTAQARVLADLDPMEMTREELVSHLAELATDGRGDDELREAVFGHRERVAARDADAAEENGSGDHGGGGGGSDSDSLTPGGAATDDDVRLRAMLGTTVENVKATVAEFTDKTKLSRLRELEVEDKNRAGVTKAIDEKVASLEA